MKYTITIIREIKPCIFCLLKKMWNWSYDNELTLWKVNKENSFVYVTDYSWIQFGFRFYFIFIGKLILLSGIKWWSKNNSCHLLSTFEAFHIYMKKNSLSGNIYFQASFQIRFWKKYIFQCFNTIKRNIFRDIDIVINQIKLESIFLRIIYK